MTTQSARITGPVLYTGADGHKDKIPLGPCLVERLDDRLIDIIRGLRGSAPSRCPLKRLNLLGSTATCYCSTKHVAPCALSMISARREGPLTARSPG
jgi:hypothetical protein